MLEHLWSVHNDKEKRKKGREETRRKESRSEAKAVEM